MRNEVLFVFVALLAQQVFSERCSNNIICSPPQQCCANTDTCCLPDGYEHHYRKFRWSVWNMWYFWFVMIFVLMSCFGGCGYWRRRQLLLTQRQHSMLHTVGYNDIFGQRLFGLHSMGSTRRFQIHQSSLAGFDRNFACPRDSRPPLPHEVLPTGIFPSPPPYSEFVKNGEVSTSMNAFKDGLPTYSQTDDTNINTSERTNVLVRETRVPGLPPYTLLVSEDANSALGPETNDTVASPIVSSTPAYDVPSCQYDSAAATVNTRGILPEHRAVESVSAVAACQQMNNPNSFTLNSHHSLFSPARSSSPASAQISECSEQASRDIQNVSVT